MSEQQIDRTKEDEARDAYILANRAYAAMIEHNAIFQNRMLAFAERQTAAIERIAVALERLREAA